MKLLTPFDLASVPNLIERPDSEYDWETQTRLTRNSEPEAVDSTMMGSDTSVSTVSGSNHNFSDDEASD